MEGAQMLKKTALSLFGLVVMLICCQPAAGSRRRGGCDSGRRIRVRFTFVRTGMWRPCLMSPTGRLLILWADYVRPGWGYRPGFYAAAYTRRGMNIASS